MWALHWSQET